MNNVMSLGIYFEITDAELYGGKDSIGYAATIVGITANAFPGKRTCLGQRKAQGRL